MMYKEGIGWSLISTIISLVFVMLTNQQVSRTHVKSVGGINSITTDIKNKKLKP